jgi:transcriptional regulator NrdR family protein
VVDVEFEGERKGQKYCCPVCGCSTALINDPRNIIDVKRHLRRCPKCGAVLRGLGRIYMVVGKSRTLEEFGGG